MALARYKGEFVRDTKYGADLLHMLETVSNAGVWRVEREREVGKPRWWLNITLPENAQEMFDLKLEILVFYAEYDRLEPRTLSDLQAHVRRDLRVEPGIVIVATEDDSVSELASRRRGELSIVDICLPAIKEENRDLRARIAAVVTTVDHFDVTSPIQDPSGFFGRSEELSQLKHALDRGQSVGVFGLRKAGKTSLMNSLQRVRENEGKLVVKLDVSEVSTSNEFRLKLLERTWRAVFDFASTRAQEGEMRRRMPRMRLLNQEGALKEDVSNLELFWTEDLAALIAFAGVRLELFIDEIDQAFPLRSTLVDAEATKLFQSLIQLRGLIQASHDEAGVVLLCAGVDPEMFERPTLGDRDNLIYKLVRLMWLSPMSRDDMGDMVRTLGKRMGVRIPNHLTIDALFHEYGGHPLLTRKACSLAIRDRDRAVLPWVLSTEAVAAVAALTGRNTPSDQAFDVFDSFQTWFPDEAAVLELLWSEDPESRELAVAVADENPDSLMHARAYGILNDELEPSIHAMLGAIRKL